MRNDQSPNVLACAVGARSRRNTFEVGSPKLAMLLAKRLAKAISIRWPARPARFTSQNHVSLVDLCGLLGLPICISGKRHSMDNVARPSPSLSPLLSSPTAVPSPPFFFDFLWS